MSIINEALKKVEEENQKKSQPQAPKYEFQPTIAPNIAQRKVTKKPISIFLVIILLFISAFVITKMPSFKLLKEKSVNPKLIAEKYSSIPNREATASTSSLNAPFLTLNGIIYDEEMPYAIVNNKVLRKGEIIEGASLVEIDKDFVKFVFKDKEFDLRTKQ